jgi:hypothetical protein
MYRREVPETKSGAMAPNQPLHLTAAASRLLVS